MLMFDAPFPQALLDLAALFAGMSLGVDVVSPQCAGLKTTFYSKYLLMVAALVATCATLLLPSLATAARKRQAQDPTCTTRSRDKA